jgi:PKD repeat protein
MNTNRVGARLAAALAAGALLSPRVRAQDVGFEGPPFGASLSAPTESKPESKLWFNDGIWWGSLWSPSAGAFRIHRLDFATQAWIDTGVTIESRSNSRSDAFWDGSKLHVASHRFSSSGGSSGNPILFLRYGYDALTDAYALDPGFPVTIGSFSTEALTIDKDSTGTLWAAWIQAKRVHVTHTLGSDAVWRSPMMLPACASDVTSDDVCGLVPFNGDRIGVLWSDQNADAFLFSVHLDGAPDTAWSAAEPATLGESDDHLNLAAHSDGRVLFVGKNAANNLLLLVRALDGSWSRHVVSASSPIMTRPILLLDESAGMLHVFATGQTTGEVFEKTSPIDAISFGPGQGTVRMRDASAVYRISNPTSTKQNVDASTGLVVLAHHDTTGFYWRHAVPPTTGAPVAAFTASPASGELPLAVAFTSTSSGTITSYAWTFGDGGTSSAANPTHTYAAAGTYGVSLTATGPLGTDTEVKPDLIAVTAPSPPIADFVASPTSGPAPLLVTFTDASGGSVTARAWSFGDGQGSSARDPQHAYGAPGTYSVTLTVTNPSGSSTMTRTDLVRVDPPPPLRTFLPVADAHASESKPTTSYGTGTALRVKNQSGGSFQSFLCFDLTDLGGSVTSAVLRLFCTDGSNSGGHLVAGVASDWSETSLTWASRPALPAPLAPLGAVTAGRWVELDVSSVVTGPGLHSFALAGGSTNSAMYSSREGMNPAQLVVETGTPTTPQAAFSARPLAGPAPLEVAFQDESTGAPTSWAWSFGDGGTSSERNPVHVYAAPGAFTVSLSVSSALGSPTVTRSDLVVAGPPAPVQTLLPVADARVSEGNPASNAGADAALRVRAEVGGSYHTYLRFDLSGVTPPIASARLRLHCTDGSPVGGLVFPTTGAWSELGITWATKPDATGSQGASLGPVSTGAWVEVDVSAAVSAGSQVDLLLTSTSSNSAYYSSREGSNPPELVLSTAP